MNRLERINLDLERLMQEQATELESLRQESRQNKENQIL